MELPFRVVHHTYPDPDAGVEHLDLFIQATDGVLICYEIVGEDMLKFRRELYPDEPGGSASELQLLAGTEGIRARRKADHRALYWTYAGPISDGRGEIRELARGRISAREVGTPEIFLKLLRRG